MASAPKPSDMGREEAQATCDSIRRGMNDIRDLVLELHDRRGWLALGYGSWRDCVVAEFDQSKSHLYRQLDAARIEREISPMGEKPGRVPERQLRPLAIVPEGQRAEVWEEAKATAPAGKVTAKHVRETVDRRVGKPPESAEARIPQLGKNQAEDSPPPMSRVNGRLAPDPPDIAKARADGRIPEGVVVEVTEPEPAPESPEEADHGEPELSDEEWLAGLPLNSKLEGSCLRAFQRDALYFRENEPARKKFQHHASRVRNAARQHGPYARRTKRWMKTDHPKHWLLCPAGEHGGCGGTGQFEMIGQCPKCYGNGFWIK